MYLLVSSSVRFVRFKLGRCLQNRILETIRLLLHHTWLQTNIGTTHDITHDIKHTWHHTWHQTHMTSHMTSNTYDIKPSGWRHHAVARMISRRYRERYSGLIMFFYFFYSFRNFSWFCSFSHFCSKIIVPVPVLAPAPHNCYSKGQRVEVSSIAVWAMLCLQVTRVWWR